MTHCHVDFKLVVGRHEIHELNCGY